MCKHRKIVVKIFAVTGVAARIEPGAIPACRSLRINPGQHGFFAGFGFFREISRGVECMKKITPCLLSLAVILVAGVQPLSSMEITGAVKSVPVISASDGHGMASLSPVAGTTVKAMTRNGELIAESETDGTGLYKLSIPDTKTGEAFLLSAETRTGAIRALVTDPTHDINPITEALTWRILESGVPAANYTAEEIAFMLGSLYELAKAADFSNFPADESAAGNLIDIPKFNIALGNLAATYGMAGNNMAQVEAVKGALHSFTQAFAGNDANAIRAVLAENAEISIHEEIVKGVAPLLEKIDALHRTYQTITLEVEFARIEINRDRAEVSTYERLKMKSGDGQDVDEPWVARNILELKNSRWQLVARETPSVHVVEKAAIEPDGRIDDWAGIVPSYLVAPEAAAQDAITALFFARDDRFLYWRMDLDMKPSAPLSKNIRLTGIPRGEYYLYIYADESEQKCNSLLSFVNNEVTSAAAGARICVTGKDGVEKAMVLPYQRFAVGSHSIEGSVPFEDLAFLSEGFFGVGMGKRRSKPGEPENPMLSTGFIKLNFK